MVLMGKGTWRQKPRFDISRHKESHFIFFFFLLLLLLLLLLVKNPDVSRILHRPPRPLILLSFGTHFMKEKLLVIRKLGNSLLFA